MSRACRSRISLCGLVVLDGISLTLSSSMLRRRWRTSGEAANLPSFSFHRSTRARQSVSPSRLRCVSRTFFCDCIRVSALDLLHVRAWASGIRGWRPERLWVECWIVNVCPSFVCKCACGLLAAGAGTE
eukprot:scaffold3587_cov109-Isochrysis_galbana.AAC.2